MKTKVTGYLTQKHGFYYVVLNLPTDEKGKRNRKTLSTGLSTDRNATKAKALLLTMIREANAGEEVRGVNERQPKSQNKTEDERWNEVDGEYLLHIPFASDGAQLGVTGEDLLKALTPISGDIGSNGTIEFNGQSFSKSDLTEETLEWLEWYNSLSPEEQLAVSSIPADLYTDDGAGTLDSNAEE